MVKLCLQELFTFSIFCIYIRLIFCINSPFCYIFHDDFDNNTISCTSEYWIKTSKLKELNVLNRICNYEGLIFPQPGNQSSKREHLNFVRCPISIAIFVQFFSVRHFVSQESNTNEVLQHNAFRGICNVKTMSLKKNGIQNIESGAFKCVKNIETLDLSDNKIESLPAYIFNSMQNLSDLRLNGNRIRALDKHVFMKLSNLLILDLSSNKLRNLRNIFENNQNLERLEVGRNANLVLEDDCLSSLVNLKYLNIEQCGLVTLLDRLFLNNGILDYINAKKNFFTEISNSTFGALKNLEKLDLSVNDIVVLRNQPFKLNEKLTFLNLHKNELTEIKDDYFRGLSSLTQLDISQNLITKIDQNSFKDMSHLQFLNFSHNHLSSLPGSHLFIYNQKLKILDVSFNKLTYIQNTKWQDLKQLESFWVTNNKLEELFIPQIPHYKIFAMHLEDNKLKRIGFHPNIDLNSDMEIQFFLSGNPLNCDCHAYELYEYMKNGSLLRFHLNKRFICQFPKENQGKEWRRLKPSDFICDSLKYCPQRCACSFNEVNQSTMVNCSGRGYEYLPFLVPSNTKILYIGQNNLTSLEDLKESLWENLTEIYAEENQIISESIFIPQNVKFLSLQSNQLEIFPETLRKHAKSTQDFRMTLSNNFWPCNCSVLPLKEFLLEREYQVADFLNVRCVHPNGSWNAIRLSRIKNDFLCPKLSDYKFLIQSVIGIALLSLFTGGLTMYLRRNRNFLYFMFTHCNVCYRLLCKDQTGEDEEKLYDCFISYGSEDRDLSYSIIEHFKPDFKFCTHERNWKAGECITNSIHFSVQNSRKTLIVLTQTFVLSEWFQLEFQAAFHQMQKDRMNRIILVVNGDLPDMINLNRDVQFVIAMKTYLQWGDRRFWKKLQYALHEQKPVYGNKYIHIT